MGSTICKRRKPFNQFHEQTIQNSINMPFRSFYYLVVVVVVVRYYSLAYNTLLTTLLLLLPLLLLLLLLLMLLLLHRSCCCCHCCSPIPLLPLPFTIRHSNTHTHARTHTSKFRRGRQVVGRLGTVLQICIGFTVEQRKKRQRVFQKCYPSV